MRGREKEKPEAMLDQLAALMEQLEKALVADEEVRAKHDMQSMQRLSELSSQLETEALAEIQQMSGQVVSLKAQLMAAPEDKGKLCAQGAQLSSIAPDQ